MIKKMTYMDSGVNIELGDDVSKILYNAAKQTWENRKGGIGEVIVPFDDFSGVRAIDVSGLPKGTMMNIGFDGVGTKVEIAERTGNYSTLAYDLFAMVCDDAVVSGAEPVLIGSILDVNSLTGSIEKVKQLAHGYVAAAKEANVAVVNGEVAELGNRVGGFGSFNCNWGAAVVWFAKKERMFTGSRLKEGDSVVALKETGFRSNGFSLLRKILKDARGDDWHNDEKLAKQALQPSRIYSAGVCDMFGGYSKELKAELHAVAHITGGGIPGKLGRALRSSGLGANLDSLFEPCDLMLYLQKKGGVADQEAYRTWNMGNGMLIVTPEPENVIAIAKQHRIEAKIAGKITAEKGIRIKSKGNLGKGKTILFE